MFVPGYGFYDAGTGYSEGRYGTGEALLIAALDLPGLKQGKTVFKEGVKAYKGGKTLFKAEQSTLKAVKSEAERAFFKAEKSVVKVVKPDDTVDFLRNLSKKEQPWTIRPNQEWKTKVYGRGQKTGTEGHAIRSYRIAIKEAKKADADTALLNRGVKRATGENIKPNTRPDVTVIKKDGTVHQFEVRSKTDRAENLQKRMDDATQKFSPGKQGENKVIEITKTKDPTK